MALNGNEPKKKNKMNGIVNAITSGISAVKGGGTAENKGGTYMAFPNGRVGRTYGLNSPYESMDTTGYSKGKKDFTLTASYGGGQKMETPIKRKDVPSKIEEFKKGATRTIIRKK